MHADEVDTDSALVGRLLAEQFPHWADLADRTGPAHGDGQRALSLGDDMVARLARTERTSRRLEKERLWLPRLAPSLPLAVPVPLAEGAPAEGYPFAWSVYTWLQGENATFERIADLSQLATDLAQFVADLQADRPRRRPGTRGAQLLPRCAARGARRVDPCFDRRPRPKRSTSTQ